jgi:hypothetical protein
MIAAGNPAVELLAGERKKQDSWVIFDQSWLYSGENERMKIKMETDKELMKSFEHGRGLSLSCLLSQLHKTELVVGYVPLVIGNSQTEERRPGSEISVKFTASDFPC